MNNPTIFHIITTIDRGGAEKALLTLVKAQIESGLEVTVFPLKGDLELLKEFEANGVRVDHKYSNASLLSQIRYLRSLSSPRIIMHAHLPRAEIVTFFASVRNSFVITRHNAEKFFPKAIPSISALLSRCITSKAAVTIVISDAVAMFLRINNELSRHSKVKTIYYGFDFTSEHKETSHKSAQAGDFKAIVGTISRLAPQKNLLMFIEVVELLLSKQIDVQGQIVGGGPLLTYLQNEIHKRSLDERLILKGRTNDIETFLRNLDIFVLFSNYEGFGLVLLEAMNEDIPVVACSNSAIPEVLGREHPGLIPTGNATIACSRIIGMFSDPDLRNRTIEYQREQLRLFTVKKYVSSHAKLYKEIVSYHELNGRIGTANNNDI